MSPRLRLASLGSFRAPLQQAGEIHAHRDSLTTGSHVNCDVRPGALSPHHCLTALTVAGSVPCARSGRSRWHSRAQLRLATSDTRISLTAGFAPAVLHRRLVELTYDHVHLEGPLRCPWRVRPGGRRLIVHDAAIWQVVRLRLRPLAADGTVRDRRTPHTARCPSSAASGQASARRNRQPPSARPPSR